MLVQSTRYECNAESALKLIKEYPPPPKKNKNLGSCNCLNCVHKLHVIVKNITLTFCKTKPHLI